MISPAACREVREGVDDIQLDATAMGRGISDKKVMLKVCKMGIQDYESDTTEEFLLPPFLVGSLNYSLPISLIYSLGVDELGLGWARPHRGTLQARLGGALAAISQRL